MPGAHGGFAGAQPMPVMNPGMQGGAFNGNGAGAMQAPMHGGAGMGAQAGMPAGASSPGGFGPHASPYATPPETTGYVSPHSPQGIAAQNAQLTGALFAGEHYDTLSATAYAAPGTAGQPSEVFGGLAQSRATAPGFAERAAQQAPAYRSAAVAYGADPFASTFGQSTELPPAAPATQSYLAEPPAYEESHGDSLARAMAARAALANANQHVVPLTASEAASKGLGRIAPPRDEFAEPAQPSAFAFDHVEAKDPPYHHRARSAEESPARAQDTPSAERTLDAAPAAERGMDRGSVERTAERAVDAPQAKADIAVQSADLQEALLERVKASVLDEIHSMRGALEEQLAGLQWSDRQRRQPVRNAIAKTLISTGFSAQFTNLLLDRMPQSLQEQGPALDWIKAAIERNLPVLDDEDVMMEKGGVYALMGPTGVGKTTTTAKLAARCVMRFGADRVALLTTDSYRIGAHEQLRIYGKILGVSVHAVKDAADLKLTLDELRNKHIVLIDTIGMSQRDRALTEQVAMLCGTGRPVQRLLLLNATSHGDTLNEVVHAYRGHPSQGAQTDLSGCILTKLDEATNIGAALDTVIRYRLPVHYVSTGQKVPENLYVARKPFLMKSAFCIPRESSPFTPADDDFPVVMAGSEARSTAELSEVRLG
ncbi:flagellar biosynthesis protein FlhF [Pararobbsia silviterrae]|uniref:Flagellar biosynthesis protein FlhF n=2 Tax=Pararobbsia silviterrae TaxID=1792498 RepID=A0A494XB87_9BURK|nr:flagellar biosynthesis protein FlhF [Pararobbsia silviterrae]